MPIVSRFLNAIHSHPRWSWAGLLAYAAAVSFPHENVQWLMNQIAIRITHQHLYRISAEVGGAEALLFTLIVIWRLRAQPARYTLIGFWILTLALIGFTRWAFTANDLELVHYPQYLPEGVALVALTLSPAESLCWVVIFGGLDEAYQYAVLSWFRPAPFDFNDVFMDLLGGALGVLLGMLFLRCVRRETPLSPPLWKRPGIVALLSILATGIVLWASGLMLLFEDKTDMRHWFSLSRFRAPAFWFQVAANGPDKYHTLSPIEGPILILGIIALYSVLDRRLRIATTNS
ncbi:MAG TPA: hypothetical protein VHW09_13165 [Bryobacteraceae bacterium]|nr:hypothetical protein [Bryobacteraceae bacterium]